MRYLTLSLRQVFLIVMFCLALVVFPLISQGVNAQSIPYLDGEYGNWVTDKADILSPSTEVKLNTRIKNLQREQGTEIAVVTVPQTNSDDSPQAFATELFEEWKVDQPARENGMLLLISQEDKRVEIRTGYAVKAILPNLQINEIQESHIVPHLKNGDFDTGVLNGTQALIAAITNPEHQFGLTLPERQRLWFLSAVMAGISFLSYAIARFCCRPVLLPTGNPPQLSRVKFVQVSQPLTNSDATEIVVRFRGYLSAIAVGLTSLSRTSLDQRFTLALDFLYGTSWTGILALSFLVMSQGLGMMLILLILPYFKLIPSAILKVKQQHKVTGKLLVIGAIIAGILLYQLLRWLAWLIIMFPVVSAVFIAFPVAFSFAPLLVNKLKQGVNNKLTYLDAETRQSLSAIAPDILNRYLSEAQKVTKRLGSMQYQGFRNAQGDLHIRAIEADTDYQECPHCQELTVSRSQQTLKRANLSSYGICLVTLTCECCGYHTQDHQAILSNGRSGSYSSYGESGVWGGGSYGGGNSFGGGSSGGGSSGGGGAGGNF